MEAWDLSRWIGGGMETVALWILAIVAMLLTVILMYLGSVKK